MSKHDTQVDGLQKIIDLFSDVTVTVLGDMVADEFIFGEISRVSREAPVLILKHRDRKVVPGGGANAINNLADLGIKVLPVGVVGNDEPGRLLLNCFQQKRIPISGVFKNKRYQTTTKTRILAGMPHTARQQVVRVDREPEGEPDTEVKRSLVQAAREFARTSNAMLISDYGYGAATPALWSAIRGSRGHKKIPAVLDSRYRLLEYWQSVRVHPGERHPQQLEEFGFR